MTKIVVLDQDTLSRDDRDFDGIRALGDVKLFDHMPEAETIRACEGAEAILFHKTDMTRSLISALPDLKYIGTYATGYNNIDLEICKKRGITVTNAPAYSTDAVAQHTVSLLLMAAGNAHRYAEDIRRGQILWDPLFPYAAYSQHEVRGKTLGIFGFGEIGAAVAKIADALGMRVVVHSRRKPENCPYEYLSAEELFQRSDFISLHCPLTDETRGIINERTLSMMKKTAVLINTARGGLIDEDALLRALREKRLACSCLDVVADEPIPRENKFAGLDNAIITPHIGWSPQETRKRLFSVVADHLRAYLSGDAQNVIV